MTHTRARVHTHTHTYKITSKGKDIIREGSGLAVQLNTKKITDTEKTNLDSLR